jgi:hypothetical protein
MDLGTVADELYGLPPGEFVSLRDARASEARSEGDHELAAAIKQLRRPTAVAWIANLLVRERRDHVTQLLGLGDEMRRAQRDLAGDELRRLSQRRRQLVSALSAEATGLARGHGHQMTGSSRQELEATLEAAVADESAGEALLSGRLTAALRYAGFGSVDLTGIVAAPHPTRSVPPLRARRASPVSAKGMSPVAERRREKQIDYGEQLAAGAAATLAGAEKSLEAAADRLNEAHQERSRLEERMSDLHQELRSVRDNHEKAKRAERQAQKQRDLAERDLQRARARVAEVTAELRSLRSTTD